MLAGYINTIDTNGKTAGPGLNVKKDLLLNLHAGIFFVTLVQHDGRLE